MKNLAWVALIVTACGFSTGVSRERIEVNGPTVIGFVHDASHEDFERLNERAIIQDDFVTSWSEFAEWAEQAHVKARTAAPDFEINTRKGTRRIRGDAGYVVINSSGEWRVLRGVRTGADLQTEACAFWRSTSEIISACGGG